VKRAPLIVLLAGCSESIPATQILVRVTSDFTDREMPTARIHVERDGREVFASPCVCLDEGATCKRLPLTLGLGPEDPRGPAGGPFRVRATGCSDGALKTRLVGQSATARFVQGRSPLLEMALFRSCRDNFCDRVKTCRDGDGRGGVFATGCS